MSAPAKKSSAGTKEKDLMLDKDMEKDTWNFKSMTDDDPMDFGFESPAENKKNAFKLDMGFDLGGDFGNMSSFKMDMPDFDFSSPAKKTTKTKESSDDKSSGEAKPKKDLFAFSYDFDALDDFSLDPSPPKKGSETTTKTMDCEETAAGRKFGKSDDLDFSLDPSPPKKGSETTTKTMDCEETATGRRFDKSDDLDFGPDLPVTGKAASKANTDVMENAMTKTMDYVETAAGRKFGKSDALDFGPDLPVTRKATPKAKTDIKANPSAEKENRIAKTADSMVFEYSTHSKQAAPESMENSEAVESPQSPRIPQSVSTSSLKTSCPMDDEIDEPCPSNETAAASPLHASETAYTAGNRETSPGINEICRSVTKEDSPRDTDQSAYTSMESSPEKKEPNISSQLGLEKNGTQQEEMATDTQAEIGDETRRTLFDPDTELSQQNLSGKISPGTRPSQTAKVQDSNAKQPLAPLHSVRGTDTQEETGDQTKRRLDPDPRHSQTTLPGIISLAARSSQTVQTQDSSAKLPPDLSHSVPGFNDLKTVQNKDVGLIRSRFFKKPEQLESHVRESSPARSESRLVTPEMKGSHMHESTPARTESRPVTREMKGSLVRESSPAPTESRLVSREMKGSQARESSPARTESRPVTREMKGLILNSTDDRSHGMKDALLGSKTRTCPTKVVNMDADKNAPNVNTSRTNPTISSSSCHEKKTIDKDHSNAKAVEQVAGLLDRSKMQAKNTTRERSMLQINISSKLDASSLTQKLSKHLSSGVESSQNSKIVSLERPKLGNISSDLRAAKTQRTIGVNKHQPSSSSLQPEVNSSINNERKTETPIKKSSEIHQLAPRDKTQTLHFPSSFKRKALYEDADRSLKPPPLKRVSISPRENRNVENSPIVNNSPRIKSHHQIINMANLEIPITVNDDKVEKAEAYTKELENICNILKKKHEEAKELLVRAVVNTNQLLMLNHPLYEDKIRMVQKFAAKLTSKEQDTMMHTQTTVA